MVRDRSRTGSTCRSSPHPRGDGPRAIASSMPALLFSPPAWGWSAGPRVPSHPTLVLPTRVGMVRHTASNTTPRASSPHPRGDGPPRHGIARVEVEFSPPAWGWSVQPRLGRVHADVLPTRVGMVRARLLVGAQRFCSPHPRGDGPPVIKMAGTVATFSPPAWGWSAIVVSAANAWLVLPTRVGMVRSRLAGKSPARRSPHPRGDGPVVADATDAIVAFSPPAWGWSEWFQPGVCRHCVLPTRVGMVR